MEDFGKSGGLLSGPLPPAEMQNIRKSLSVLSLSNKVAHTDNTHG